MLEKLDELAAEGYDIKINQFGPMENWRVDISWAGNDGKLRNVIFGEGRDKEIEKAIQAAFIQVDENREAYFGELENQEALANKARLGVKPQLKKL